MRMGRNGKIVDGMGMTHLPMGKYAPFVQITPQSTNYSISQSSSTENLLVLYTVSQKTSPFYFANNSVKKLTDFNGIIHTYFRLFMLSQKNTNCYPLTHHT